MLIRKNLLKIVPISWAVLSVSVLSSHAMNDSDFGEKAKQYVRSNIALQNEYKVHVIESNYAADNAKYIPKLKIGSTILDVLTASMTGFIAFIPTLPFKPSIAPKVNIACALGATFCIALNRLGVQKIIEDSLNSPNQLKNFIQKDVDDYAKGSNIKAEDLPRLKNIFMIELEQAIK
jgi:hypothetical protein